MPLYEYRCLACEKHFDVLRAMSAADKPIACPNCGEVGAKRAISLFSALGSDGIIAGAGGSCGSCTPSGSCATCPSRSAR
jgi:putative FmdB family regulatory protein